MLAQTDTCGLNTEVFLAIMERILSPTALPPNQRAFRNWILADEFLHFFFCLLLTGSVCMIVALTLRKSIQTHLDGALRDESVY